MEYAGLEILLIEDNANDAELTIRTLQKSSIASYILHLKDGADALDFLFGQGSFSQRNLKNMPKVILLDLKMPKVTGIEVLQKVKSEILTKSIPVVVLTSSKESRDIEKAYALGANSFITKPVDFESFRKIVVDLGNYWLMLNQSPI